MTDFGRDRPASSPAARWIGRLAVLLLALGLAAPASLLDPVDGAAPVAADRAPAAESPPPLQPPRTDERTGRARSRDGAAPSKKERIRRGEERCTGAGMVWLPELGICTHGSDPAPPGFDVRRRVAALPATRANRAAAALDCDGNGQSGPRVQVLYGRGADVPSRFAAFRASLEAWTADADAIMRDSAQSAGGDRRFRFVTGPDCRLDIREVVLSPAGDNDFDATIEELYAQGYDRTDRIYLIYVDTTRAGICGIGSLWIDDGDSQTNWNNYGPSFARVDAGCWNGYTAAHELMHNLGGVQDSAPNTTLGFHCVDEYDVMCYSDEPSYPDMRYDCPDNFFEARFDCGNNDYFHPAPPPGSYLDAHWNTADNRFLVGGGDGPDDAEPPSVAWVAPVTDDRLFRVSAGTVAFEATAADDAGVNRVEFWRFDEATEEWMRFASDRTPPYESALDAADLPMGVNWIDAVAFDGVYNYTTASIRVEREPDRTKPTVRIAGYSDGIVTVDASDPSGVEQVEVRSCPDKKAKKKKGKKKPKGCTWNAGAVAGSDTNAPYDVVWEPPSAGKYILLAQATDEPGNTATSAQFRVTVTASSSAATDGAKPDANASAGP